MTRLRAHQRRNYPYLLAALLLPKGTWEPKIKEFAAILDKLGDSALNTLMKGSRQPGAPMMAQRDKVEVANAKAAKAAEKAKKILVEGLKYHEHDGHNMPKKVARAALEALGVPEDQQP